VFSFQVKRKCGHEETVTVPGPPEGTGLKQYVDEIDWEEGNKLCPSCQAELDALPPPWVDNAIAAIVWFGIVLVFSLFCWVIGC
jgi:hypothetical protein